MAKDWGDIYGMHLRKGEDHGYAAHMADKWQQRNQPEAWKAAHAIKGQHDEKRKADDNVTIPRDSVELIQGALLMFRYMANVFPQYALPLIASRNLNTCIGILESLMMDDKEKDDPLAWMDGSDWVETNPFDEEGDNGTTEKL